MKRFLTIITLFLFGVIAMMPANSSAGISFNINNEEVAKTKILFVGFEPNDPRLKNDATEILERIRKNLKSTDLFEVMKSSGRMMAVGDEQNKSFDAKGNVILPEITVESTPDFAKYVQSGLGAIIVAQFNYDEESNLELRLRMWDVLDQKQLFGKLYSSSRGNYKRMANLISDEIFKAITGEKQGHFNSKILYVSETGSVKRRIKKVTLMDFDGDNRLFLTDGKDLVLTPVFSKNPGEIYYLRYFENRPQIFTLNMSNLTSRKLGGFRGTTFAASVHPKDPNLVLLSAIFDGNSDIYEMNIAKNSATRLTKSPAIDTTPSYSPDGNSIIFVSDRDSGQQIYLMNKNGTEVKRVSFGAGSYAKPVFSPDGSMIAFTRIKSGQFYIGTMSANGKNERLLTTGYVVEGAKWSPNGRYLLFSKKRTPYGEGSIPRLYIVDITTGFEFEMPTPKGEGATDPDWVSN